MHREKEKRIEEKKFDVAANLLTHNKIIFKHPRYYSANVFRNLKTGLNEITSFCCDHFGATYFVVGCFRYRSFQRQFGALWQFSYLRLGFELGLVKKHQILVPKSRRPGFNSIAAIISKYFRWFIATSYIKITTHVHFNVMNLYIYHILVFLHSTVDSWRELEENVQSKSAFFKATYFSERFQPLKPALGVPMLRSTSNLSEKVPSISQSQSEFIVTVIVRKSSSKYGLAFI